MFTARVNSIGFSRYVSATTTHITQALRGSIAVVVPEAEKLTPSPAAKTNQSFGSLAPVNGNVIATNKMLGKISYDTSIRMTRSSSSLVLLMFNTIYEIVEMSFIILCFYS